MARDPEFAIRLEGDKWHLEDRRGLSGWRAIGHARFDNLIDAGRFLAGHGGTRPDEEFAIYDDRGLELERFPVGSPPPSGRWEGVSL